MTLEEMKQRKQELGYSNQTISEKSGVPFGTVQKIFSGQTKFPREETIKALETLLSPHPKMKYDSVAPEQTGGMVHDSFAYDTKQGGYTLEDYLALPDERRVELIDGVFYDMTAPTTVHQAIGGFIHKILLDFVLKHDGECMPFMSPVDVQLDKDDKTIVQPDVLIVCDRSKFQNGRVFGAPDFVIEVLSPSTSKKDCRLKLYKYGEAGVREYWIIDPKRKSIVVYDFEHSDIPSIYSFDDKVPVQIWDCQCQVDFSEIYQRVSFLYDEI